MSGVLITVLNTDLKDDYLLLNLCYKHAYPAGVDFKLDRQQTDKLIRDLISQKKHKWPEHEPFNLDWYQKEIKK